MTPLELIIRMGCTAEAAAVYEAVGKLCESANPSERLELLGELEQAYLNCEGEYERCVKAIEDFKRGNGKPAELSHTWKPG